MKDPGIRSRARSGAALILTLFFIALVTVIVIGFLVSMKVEISSATSHLGGIEADFYAQEAEDIARTRLYSVFFNTNQAWISQPGAIYSAAPGNQPAVTALSSGSGAVGSTVDQAVDLNPVSLVNTSLNIIGTNSPMVVQWIYQYQDGTFNTNAATALPSYNATNPVVGRFGFWVDDESAKLNINTAYGRNSTNLPFNPAQVSLGYLNANDPAAIAAYRNSTGYFNTVDELARVANVSSGLLAQSFSLTPYNHSPAPRLNMLGKQPILLTTQASVAQACGYTNYLNVLSTPNVDPGTQSVLSASGVSNAVANIVAGLTNASWPLMPGQSFKNKYPDVVQIAVNIIDYVRSAESTNLIVEPLRGTNYGTAFGYSAGAGYSFGVSRRPTITEMAVLFPPSQNPSAWAAGTHNYLYPTFVVEMYYPHIADGWNQPVPLSNLALVPYLYGQWTDDTSQLSSPNSGPFNSEDYGVNTTISPGQYVYVTNGKMHLPSGSDTNYVFGPFAMPGPTLQQALTQLATNIPGSYNNVLRLTLCTTNAAAGTAPRISSIDNPIQYSFANSGVETTGMNSSSPQAFSIDDPFANLFGANWQAEPETFGAQNGNCTLGTTKYVTGVAQQDTDGNGNIAEGVVLPAPKGSSQNPLGLVQSLGELGFIHTGQSSLAAADNVPWRTVRLQPETAGSTNLPDWLMLDLFAVPNSNAVSSISRPFLQPNDVTNTSGTVTNIYAFGGKVNINANLLPFLTYPERLLPLESVLVGIPNNTTNSASTLPTGSIPTVASNILNQVLANQTLSSGIVNQGRAFTAANGSNIFFSPGQVAEIAGVSDTGEASEEMVRQLVSLTAVQGGVFTIYTVGQSVKQDPTGTFHILGESRRATTVERTFWSDGTIHLQPLYTQLLQP